MSVDGCLLFVAWCCAVAYGALVVVRCVLPVVCCALFVCCFVVSYSWCGARCPLFVDWDLSLFAVCCALFVSCCLLFVEC